MMSVARRQIRLQVAGLFTTGVLLCGCATVPAAQPDEDAPYTLVGRVLSSGDVIVWVGDSVMYDATSYHMEPVDAPGTIVTVVSSLDCPQEGDQIYSMVIERRQMFYAETSENPDKSLLTDLEVTSCQPVAQ